MGDITTKFPRKSRQQSSTDEDCIIFRGWDSAVDDVSQSESGVCSPTLWGSNNSRTSPQFHRPRNRSLSPTSRTQAIARGQQELMEMVRNMPESSYELSLKDLVEHHRLSNSDRQQDGSVAKDDSSSETSFRRDASKKRSETRALVTRSRSVDGGGFYLKMFFPLPFGQVSAKKKRNNNNLRTDSGLNGSSRVSPKPPPPPPVDRDWWRKRSGENDGSVSGGSMTSSGSSNSTSSERSNGRNSESQGSCWFCISPLRSKDRE